MAGNRIIGENREEESSYTLMRLPLCIRAKKKRLIHPDTSNIKADSKRPTLSYYILLKHKKNPSYSWGGTGSSFLLEEALGNIYIFSIGILTKTLGK